jgi:hypothetical protein
MSLKLQAIFLYAQNYSIAVRNNEHRLISATKERVVASAGPRFSESAIFP